MSEPYLELHRFIYYPVNDSFSLLPEGQFCFRKETAGPIFPDFIEADFSSYEGFRSFTERYGLDGVATFSESLKGELELRFEAARNGEVRKPIEGTYLNKEWHILRDQLEREQSGVKKLFEFQQRLFSSERIALIDKGDKQLCSPLDKRLQGSRQFSDILAILPYLAQKKDRWSFQFGSDPAPIKVVLDTSQDFKNIDINDPDWEPKWKQVAQFPEMKPLGQAVPFSSESIDYAGAQVIPKELLRGAIRHVSEYKSIVARCYSELVALIVNDKTVIRCGLCKKYFIPTRKNNAYCDRVFDSSQLIKALSKIDTNLSPDERFRQSEKVRKKHTCRKLGPRTKYELSLNKKTAKADSRAQYQKLWNRMGYAKKRYGVYDKRYIEAKAALDLFKEANNKGRGSNG